MSIRPNLTVVRLNDAPPPMLPAEVDLVEMPEVLLNIEWLRNSRLRMVSSPEEMLAAITLQAASLHEKPSGSLPSDDAELAFLAGYAREKAGWLSVKDAALNGWVLCSDDRYYRTDVSRKVLNAWIKRLAARKKADAGNAARHKLAFDPAPYDEAIGRAAAILGGLDPYAPILRNYKNTRPDIAPLASSPASSAASSNVSSTPKGSEAKGREGKEMLGLRPSDAGAREDPPSGFELEVGKPADISAEVVIQSQVERSEPEISIQECIGLEQPAEMLVPGTFLEPTEASGVIPAWPPNAFELFWTAYPHKVGRGQAERAFAVARKARAVSFPTLLSAIDRYIRFKPPTREWCNPATWLNGKRWTDEWPSGTPPPLRDGRSRPISGAGSALAGLHLRLRPSDFDV